ncbi:hypothetical protein [Marinobacterium arenosum]|uniref:hypothetical protein n=1 Tax=Marinobacterium arenosum TaxID=2862496 RepID=UPI001C963C86|nr:hypothetical protein [Marinobacterium arenosum]MBY4678311.1 hypothetical protein [Marinobacterium arenosum]
MSAATRGDAMPEFEQYDKDHAEIVAMMKSYSIENQMLILCIRQEDLLVPPEVYLDRLYSVETIEDARQLRALQKPHQR